VADGFLPISDGFLPISNDDIFVAPLCGDFFVGLRPVSDLCDGIRIQPPFWPGETPRLLFTNRPSDLQLNRRQRMRELLRLSRLADAHSADEFRDQTSDAHREVVGILQRFARS
jgi:hypothetical protein